MGRALSNVWIEHEAASERITVEPGKMGGQPYVRGLRLSVRRERFADDPDLSEADLQQALASAAAAVDGSIDFQLDAA